MRAKLYSHQEEALGLLQSGKVLVGGVGSGKSRVGASWALSQADESKIIVITTARKRDSLEWEGEFAALGAEFEKVVIDSWNNVKHYQDLYDNVFIFDEQRVVGSGTWVKSFLKITKHNSWILLSATPGDVWLDYVPLFIANGYYKNRTEFAEQHIVWDRFAKYPKVKKYLDTGLLEARRRKILVPMPAERHTRRNRSYIPMEYDKEMYESITKKRVDPWTSEPFRNAAGVCYGLRKCVNSDRSRIDHIRLIARKRKKLIVFYNFNYERDILLDLRDKFNVAEWNGHNHEPIPSTDSWVYLVQYTAGAEGWNCVETDTIVFYSLNYSWKVLEQAEGRIDRINAPFTDLHYFYFFSESGIDSAIREAVRKKGVFNERIFAHNL
nr:MAG TPA: Chromatin remodeling complex ATPase [Caudoviricetes sp.]